MRTHTSSFKEEINQFGRQIQGKITYYPSYDLVSEGNDNILTESNLQIISEQANYDEPIEISEEDIFSISIIKNGDLLQSLMKELDFETKEELNIGSVVNPQLGLLINGDYEYLDYGNYIVNSKEFNMDTETWNYVCYDKMLFSMIKYRGLSNVEYPITIKQFINKLCNKVGLEFQDSQFVNQNQLIYEDLYKNRDVTYRDIFDDISKIVAGNLMINDNDKLIVAYPLETNDTIDENYLKDTNVRVSEKIGVINSIAILDTDNNLQYIAEDTQSIKENEMTRITITDNLIALNGETQDIADNILNKLNGFYYYANDLQTIGVCYYDFLDMFNVEARGEVYQCLLLNNEITITQGIEEHIFTERFEEVETNKNEYTTSVISNKQVQFKINQQEGKIESKVEKDGIISAINQSAEEIQIQANKLSLEGKNINLTGDNIKITGKNLDIDSNGVIKLMDNSAENALTGESQETAYIVTSQATATPTGTNVDLELTNKVIAGGIISKADVFYEYDGTTTSYTTGIQTSTFSQPRVTLYGQSSDYSASSSVGSYNSLDMSLNGGISYNSINNGTINTPLTITPSGNITCVSVTQTSKKENKKNFEKLTNAKEILNNVDIYKYNFKNEDDNVKKSIGFVIGDDFNYSQEITSINNDGANIYSMVSVLWQVVKEQQEEINELKEMIKNGKY